MTKKAQESEDTQMTCAKATPLPVEAVSSRTVASETVNDSIHNEVESLLSSASVVGVDNGRQFDSESDIFMIQCLRE